jgi:GTP-binding protein
MAKPSGADVACASIQGGILPAIKTSSRRKSFVRQVALQEADAVIMVVDGRTELASPDIDLARQLIRTGKPTFL